MKVCPDCNKSESVTEFIKGRKRCRDCHNAHKRNTERISNKEYKRRRRQDPELYAKMLDQNTRWRYGIGIKDRNDILVKQDGCAICHTWEPGKKGWSIDHDHSCCSGIKSCGKCVRGVLCNSCNLTLGHAKDNVDTLIAAATYLMSKENMLMASLGARGEPQLSAGISRRLPI